MISLVAAAERKPCAALCGRAAADYAQATGTLAAAECGQRVAFTRAIMSSTTIPPIPEDVLRAAMLLTDWAKRNDLDGKDWRLGGVASRAYLEQLEHAQSTDFVPAKEHSLVVRGLKEHLLSIVKEATRYFIDYYNIRLYGHAPPGWTLVPDEITDAMYDAWEEDDGTVETAWRALLRAAPSHHEPTRQELINLLDAVKAEYEAEIAALGPDEPDEHAEPKAEGAS